MIEFDLIRVDVDVLPFYLIDNIFDALDTPNYLPKSTTSFDNSNHSPDLHIDR